MDVIKIFAFTCFGHYWLSSEGIGNTIKELLNMVTEHKLSL
jgi:hypothetical protein